jgi:F0F1-type ATP synthase epsilon subunit
VHVTVKNKTGTVTEEDARAVSSYNELGIFDVLPLHIHFISLIRKKVTIHQGKNGRDRDIDIGTGLMKVDDDKVSIYLGLPEPEQPTAKKSGK